MEYVAADCLNPNAVNPRYGRPRENLDIYVAKVRFAAVDDAVAIEEFYALCEDGRVGYGERRTDRVQGALFRAEEFDAHGARIERWMVTDANGYDLHGDLRCVGAQPLA
jgi:hypothetical protein